MRSFYKQILQDFHIYCGNRSQMRDWSDDELKKLLDVLCKISEIYSYIPEADQQRIIEGQLLRDMDYTNLNARTVSRWLELHGKQYFKDTSSYQEPEIKAEPLTGEAREKAIETFLNAVANATTELGANTTSKGSGSRMKEELESHNLVIPKEKQYKPFIIEGLEIFARSEEEAKEIYNQTVSNDTGTDNQRTEGTNQTPGL